MEKCAGIRDGQSGMLEDACPLGGRAIAFSDPAQVSLVLIRFEPSLTGAAIIEVSDPRLQ